MTPEERAARVEGYREARANGTLSGGEAVDILLSELDRVTAERERAVMLHTDLESEFFSARTRLERERDDLQIAAAKHTCWKTQSAAETLREERDALRAQVEQLLETMADIGEAIFGTTGEPGTLDEPWEREVYQAIKKALVATEPPKDKT